MKRPSQSQSDMNKPNTTALGPLLRATLLNSAVILAAVTCFGGCADYNNSTGYPPVAPAVPVLTAVSISIPVEQIEAGQAITAIAVGLDQFGQPITAGAPVYASSKSEVAGISPTTGQILGISSGATEITATIDGKIGRRTIAVVKPVIRINEIVSNGDTPGGFVELINPSNVDIDLGGWTLTAANVFSSVVVPGGFIIPAHGYAVINEINFPEGLKASDAVHLFSKFGVQVDAYSFLGNPQVDYSRCPEVDGPFLISVPTRKAANDCVNAQSHLIANNRSERVIR